MSNGHRRNAIVLALHGFTLGGDMFRDVASRVSADVVAPNLPGHGGRDAANTIWGEAVDEVVATARDLSPDLIVGYSMGGRLALNAVLASPGLTPGLMLISTSLGIEEKAERMRRLAEGRDTAARLERGGSAAEFLGDFHRSPIVQAPRSTIDLEGMRLAMRQAGLIGALRGMGQGTQPYVGDRLGELATDTIWMAGAEDRKYTAIARDAHSRTNRSTLLVVPEAGHNVVAERPDAVADAIEAALGL